MALTVSEIAERIAKPDANKAAIIERLRHWTREGLLIPLGEKNPGTGRARTYADESLIDAAVLNILADMGLRVGFLRNVLALVWQGTKDMKAQRRGSKDQYLEIDYFPDGTVLPHLHRGDWNNKHAEFSFLLNLTQLFDRLQIKKG